MNVMTLPQDPSAHRAELDEAVALLSQALAELPADAQAVTGGALRDRVLQRVGRSAARHQGMLTVRRSHPPPEPIAPGVQRRWLHRAADAAALRPGEPVWLAIVELAPGARLMQGLALAGGGSEWLVLRGALRLESLSLGTLDHHRRAASDDEPLLVAGEEGALVYLRHSGAQVARSATSRADGAAWEEFAPGIRRRILWQEGTEVGYLARAVEGATVPSHGHRHDEECLMLEGELFLGDILIREGDFQLAPAGRVHGLVQAASDCMVYIRGDAELAFDLGEPQAA